MTSSDDSSTKRDQQRAEMDKSFRAACNSFDTGAIDDALNQIQLAIDLADSPQLKSTYYTTYGRFLRETSDKEGAIIALKTAVEILRKNFHAWNQLALIFYEDKQYESAAVCLEQSLATAPDFNSYTLLAMCQSHFDRESALRSVEEALKLNPHWEEATALKENLLRET